MKSYAFACFVSILLTSGSIGWAQQIPASAWSFESQRPAIATGHAIDRQITFRGQPTLRLSGDGKTYADGRWTTMVSVQAGTYIKFHAAFTAQQVDEPDRSIQSRILWQTREGEPVERAEYPMTLLEQNKEGWNEMEQVYRVPKGAEKAKLELHFRWDADGVVHFGDFTFEETTAPAPRNVRIATIHHRPRGIKTSKEGLDQFAVLVNEAGRQKADIVCLPEGSTMVGTTLNYMTSSESVPGPTTQFLGELAKKNHLYIVAGITERKGEVVYNTSVLIDRDGKLAGVYHKLSLPREEIDGGITPGDAMPVFDTDFGRIGMMICWDVTYPEQARALSRKGAEIIFLPIWGGNLTLTKARAIENQVYVVSSTYDMISAIFDQEGEVIKEATDQHPVAIAEVNLGKQKIWEWLGDFKNRIPREMPPEKAVMVHRTQ